MITSHQAFRLLENMTEEHRGLDLTYLEHAIRTRRMDVIRHAADSTRNSGTLAARSAPACYELQDHEIVLSRATLIAGIAIFSLLTLFSIVLFSVLLCRRWRRSRQSRNAKVWGRQSFYRHQDNKRVSLARKHVDDEFSRQYRGTLVTVMENPEMGSAESVVIERGTRGEAWDDEKEKLRPKFVDVELALENGCDEGVTRKFEVVAGKVRPKGSDGPARVTTMSRVSLFWSEAVGVWMPKKLER